MLVRSLRTSVRSATARGVRGLSVQHQHAEGPDFDVVVVGAGNAMFGSPEGPWNLTGRAEAKLGPRLKVRAVIDPDAKQAHSALAAKSRSPASGSYAHTQVLPSIEAYAEQVRRGAPSPKAIFVATPAQYRGGLEPSNNLELQINAHFPSTGILLEKPIATGVPWHESVGNAMEVGRVLEARHNGVVSIGYCLRYLAVIKEMKRVIEERGSHVTATMGRFLLSQELATKKDWFRSPERHGLVVENLCDLLRYIGGDVDTASIAAEVIGDGNAALGDKSAAVFRTNWKFASGVQGSFLHGTTQHGGDSMGLEVHCDGYQMLLQDPWGTPTLAIRDEGSERVEKIPTPADDPYYTQVSNFIDTIEGGPKSNILSTYADAAKTYELTWAVRRACEAITRQHRAHECGPTLTRAEGGTGIDDLRMSGGA